MDKPELVLPHENGWAVQSKGAKKAGKVFAKKVEAASYGKKVAKNTAEAFIIYRADKTIEEKISY